MIDLSLYESLAQLLGPLPLAWDQLKVLQPRLGSRIPYSAPRNVYRCQDGKWVGLSGSAGQVALRVFDAIGRPELRHDPRFATNNARLANVDELDAIIGEWMSRHARDEALEVFLANDAALAPVYDVSEFVDDPHVVERGSVAAVDDPDLGTIRMQSVHPIFSETPGTIRWSGRYPLGACNEEVYGELGYTTDDLEALHAEGVI